MSYHIVKKIKILPDKVLITGHDNNVYPKTDEEWECTYLNQFLKDKEKVEIEILRGYEEGNFGVGAQNKWTRALEILIHLPEYKKFDWRNNNEETDKARISAEFDNLLKKVLKMKLPKNKFVITKNINNKKMYFYHRKGSNFCTWHQDIKDAKIFRWREDAENRIKWFSNSGEWQVEEIKN